MATYSSLSQYISIAPANDFTQPQAVETGLPIESLDLLRERGLTFTEMAAIVAPRTLKHRRARGENLSAKETERAIRVARVLAFAERVFGNREKSLIWLREEDDRLGDRTALSMLKTEAGGKVVESMLWAIAEGVFT